MASPRHIRNLALIGFMATGKTSVGRWLANRLLFEFVDTDALIEARSHKKISLIFAEEGESFFREYERAIVEELSGLSRTVIATGGGLAANADCLDRLKQHALVVCLWADPATIWRRASQQSHRPLLFGPDPQATIQQLLASRTPFYRQADILINTGARSIKKVAEQALREFLLVTGDPQDEPANNDPMKS